ncbi:Beta-galactosidase [Cucumis melo var. makuwa]|uniref:Beta-galactosidase n=1 Tax=Cucumis melo var. makuwa TaxID=1194695 RepID=A0A5A7TDX0_CUCMM|nr:Beta-galactosidase [Cucumis melo var. makuwa]
MYYENPVTSFPTLSSSYVNASLTHLELLSSQVTTSSGKQWFVTFIEDHTRLTWVFLISDKSKVTSTFQDFYHTIETQFNRKIAILQSDNGCEFQNHSLNEILSSKGIVHQSSCAYTSQQNGVVEQKNRHLLEVAYSLMLSTSLPSYLWCDVILTAAHLINRMPSHDALPTFIVMILTKLNSLLKLKLACLLGILSTNEAINASTHLHTVPIQDSEGMTDSINSHSNNRMSENDRPKANSTNSYTNSKASENDRFETVVLEDIGEQDSINGVITGREDRIDENKVVAKHTENETKLNHFENTSKCDPSLDLSIALRKAFTVSLDCTTIPKNIHIALECPERKNVIIEEMEALENNNTWEICALPKGHKPVGCKWVFTLKYKADGTLDRHKARLFAKEFTLTYGVDYS